MSGNETILVIVDPKARHHAALAKGALLAKKYQTRMDLLSWGTRTLDAEISGKLRSYARFLRAHGLEVNTEVISADLLNAALAERLQDHSARFVIKDVVQPAGSQPALTAIDSELTRVCPAPLLLSKPKLWPELPLICAAIDPERREQPWSSEGEAVMEEGKLLADRLAGQLHVLHTHVLAASPIWRRTTDPLESGRFLEDPAADRYVESISTLVTRLAGNVFVTGAIPRAGAPGEIADTTLDNLLQQIPCDLLVVKAAQTAETLH